MNIIDSIVIGLVCLILFLIFYTMIRSYFLFREHLIRNNPKKWERNRINVSTKSLMETYISSDQFEDENKDKKVPVVINSDGFELAGEYFDFGYERSVIIIPGKEGTVRSAKAYAQPYKELGFNILAVDNRGHGNSQGKLYSLGYREYADIINWSKLLHNRFNSDIIVFHAVSTGTSSALLALNNDQCPSYVSGAVFDSSYLTFFDFLKNQLIEMNKPVFPYAYEASIFFRLFTDFSMIFDGPVKRIKNLKKPVLFIQSCSDKFAHADKIEEMYDSCTSFKRIVWLDGGEHGQLRAYDKGKYDGAIKDFYNDRANNICFANY